MFNCDACFINSWCTCFNSFTVVPVLLGALVMKNHINFEAGAGIALCSISVIAVAIAPRPQDPTKDKAQALKTSTKKTEPQLNSVELVLSSI